MKAYRRQFIRLNMLLVGSVLLIVLVLAGVYYARSEYANIRTTMQETLEPFSGEKGSFSFTPGEPDEEADPGEPEGVPRGEDDPGEARGEGGPADPGAQRGEDDPGEARGEDGPADPGAQQEGRNKPRKEDSSAQDDDGADTGRCIAIFYEDGEGTIISGSSAMDETLLLTAAGSALASGESFGYLGEYDFFYLCTSSEQVCLYPAEYFRASLVRTGLYLLAACFGTLIAFYFISRYISGIAVRPVQQAMDREKQFVADVSHDLKTPLAVLQSCGHIIMENPAQTVGDAMPWLERSRDALENMRSLIDDMLTLSAIDQAQRLPKRDTVDLSSVVTKAVLQMEAMAYDRGITLTPDVPDNITLTGDGEALLRVVTGLIENALKYEPMGGTVFVSLAARGKKTILTVRNAGSLIPPDDLPHVFERFYRSDKARASRQGHGLGLAIIGSTVEKMGGTIGAASTPEDGTTFTVTL